MTEQCTIAQTISTVQRQTGRHDRTMHDRHNPLQTEEESQATRLRDTAIASDTNGIQSRNRKENLDGLSPHSISLCKDLQGHLQSLLQKDQCSLIEPEYRHAPHVTDDECGPQSIVATFPFQRHTAEEYLQHHGPQKLRKIVTAYIEPPLMDTVPGTGSRGDVHGKGDAGTPPEFVVPLPLRTQTPNDLQQIQYPRVQTCHDMPSKFPVDRGLEFDTQGNAIVWNVGNHPMPRDFPQIEAPYCPVEADPFLPWIHDVFPTPDGTRIEFIAQNKRRCRTGSKFTPEVNRLVPQVALMQPITVRRIHENEARELAPELWYPNANSTSVDNDQDVIYELPRYRLASFNEASPDGMYTRFICRFHYTHVGEGGEPQTLVLGETLSEYPFNYEMVAYRKGKGNTQTLLLTPRGKDTQIFWSSVIRFQCPLPLQQHPSLQDIVATGASILSDGTPTLYVDVIPIRTSTRYSEIHMTEDLIGPQNDWQLPAFDPHYRWGERNVIPRVEASGRWANIPICSPPTFTDPTCAKPVLVPKITDRPRKPHVLSACLWAAAEFKTRGTHRGATTDTTNRLIEWIEFHLMVGFDHIYVYDNSGAHTTETSLEPILSRYPQHVTRIDWPSIVCNNNIPAHDSTGERSSQYAAENSCRTRFAPYTEWIGVFDTDEYLVPMGKYTSLKDVLKDAAETGTNILSFHSSRGRLRRDKSVDGGGNTLEKDPEVTFLEAYNCDSAPSPKPSWSERARKQIYRTDYVLYHFVHYSTVTQGITRTFRESKGDWQRIFGEHPPSERVTDEINEAVMVHTKTIMRDMTISYKSHCRHDYEKKWKGCWVAYPFPSSRDRSGYDADGMDYNCYINERVEKYWIPKLRDAILKRKRSWEETDERSFNS